MPEEFERTIPLDIRQILYEIKAIQTLMKQDKLDASNNRLTSEGSIKKQVYYLCARTKTTKDMADALQKSTDYVISYLSILRREGLVRTAEKDGAQVHEQVL
jgi:hypothetical protein